MAERFSGRLKVRVLWNDRGYYKASVSHAGKSLWSGTVSRAPADRGSVDSPEAYDSAAHAALSFASDENSDVASEGAYREDGSGWIVARQHKDRWGKGHPAGANMSRGRRHPPIGGDFFVLRRDGKEVMRGSSFDIARYIHNHHSYSLDHALKYEGYSMKRE